MLSFGKNLKYYRKANNLTQKELGSIMNCTYTTINRYENNKREPNIDTLIKLADALKVKVSDLLKD